MYRKRNRVLRIGIVKPADWADYPTSSGTCMISCEALEATPSAIVGSIDRQSLDGFPGAEKSRCADSLTVGRAQHVDASPTRPLYTSGIALTQSAGHLIRPQSSRNHWIAIRHGAIKGTRFGDYLARHVIFLRYLIHYLDFKIPPRQQPIRPGVLLLYRLKSPHVPTLSTNPNRFRHT